MNEQELRALVRDAIARHGLHEGPATGLAAAGRSGPSPLALRQQPEALRQQPEALRQQQEALRQHPSHGLCAVPTGADADGPCVIEPAVPCNHCGYCKSYGH